MDPGGKATSVMEEKNKTGRGKTLREQFLDGEAEALSDGNVLELLLSFAIGRKDGRPLSRDLIQTFGGLEQVLSASPDDLSKIKGLGQATVCLIKLIRFIKTGVSPIEEKKAAENGTSHVQRTLFDPQPAEDVSDKHTPSIEAEAFEPAPKKTPPSPQKPLRRKFQVSRGYYLDFNHLARILNLLLEKRDAKKISRSVLVEDSGFTSGQLASLISIGASLGLVRTGSQILTPTGLLIAENDLFFENQGTLEWCHYMGAGTYQNLIWFDIFNHLLAEEDPASQDGWQDYFRTRLSGQYSEKTIKDHVPKEVRFVIDAYMDRNFNQLSLLHKTQGDRIYRRRYVDFIPPVLAAMIYDFCEARESHLYQVAEMAETPGSPALVFGLDPASFRQQIELLHDRGWLRYETTHNLDQIRLKPGFSHKEFLTAHFKGREPRPISTAAAGGRAR
jgi:hypothetical protein